MLILVRDAVPGQCRVQQFRIMIVHHGVIVAIHQEDRRTIPRHMMLERQTVLHRLCGKLSQQSPARPFVRTWVSHGHNGIHGSHKGYRLWRTCQLLGSMHHQMSTSREAHTPDSVCSYSIFTGTCANRVERLPQVVEPCREAAPSTANMIRIGSPSSMTVLQHKCRNAVFHEPLRHLLPLRGLVQPEVAASRTDYHPRFRRILLRDIGCQPVGLHGGGHEQACEKHQQFYFHFIYSLTVRSRSWKKAFSCSLMVCSKSPRSSYV